MGKAEERSRVDKPRLRIPDLKYNNVEKMQVLSVIRIMPAFFLLFSAFAQKNRLQNSFRQWEEMYPARKEVHMELKKTELPWWQKYTLTLNEASEYFGIGYKKLKMFVQDHSDADFVLWNGNRALIKREQFERYMNEQMNVI